MTNGSIKESLSLLRSALYLAQREGVIDKPPRVELLPEDDATPVVPPTDAVLAEALAEAEKLRGLAPLLPEAIELSIETGLRQGELFNVTWGSIDYSLGPKREGVFGWKSRAGGAWSAGSAGCRRTGARAPCP